MPKPKSKSRAHSKAQSKPTSEPASNSRKPTRGGSFLWVIRLFWRHLKRLGGWLCSPWQPRDPVLCSLRLLKRHGGNGSVPERQWRQLEQQARTLAKKGQDQKALTILHCLLLLKPQAAAILKEVERLTARQQKLSLNSKGISGTTRDYRKQQLDLYVQKGSVKVLESAARL